MAQDWFMKGELVLNCNCEVFCPCVISLGQHPPTYGYCQGWAGIRIDEGSVNGESINGLTIGLLLDIPGRMTEGGWRAAIYIDESASENVAQGIEAILSGQAGGTTGLLSMLISETLGVKRVPITYEVEGKTRTVNIGKNVSGVITPIKGGDEGSDVVIHNSEYWIDPDIVVCQSEKSKVRDFGRVWDLSGRSAELCKIDWSGPSR